MKIMLFLLAVVAGFFGATRYKIVSDRIQRVVSEWAYAVAALALAALASIFFLMNSDLGFIRGSEKFLIAVQVAIAVAICTLFLTIWVWLLEDIINSNEEYYMKRLATVFSGPIFACAAVVLSRALQERVQLESVTDIGLCIIGGVCALLYAILLYRLTIIGGNIKLIWLKARLRSYYDYDEI